MKLIFTKSNLPISWLIMVITGDDCSHMALVFESRDGGIMFDCSFLGTRPRFYKNAMKYFKVVHELPIDISPDLENKAWDLMVDRFDGKSYDFIAGLYLLWSKLIYRLFKVPIPKVNPWRSSGAYFCSEMYIILEMVGLKNISAGNAMKTPQDVWNEIR